MGYEALKQLSIAAASGLSFAMGLAAAVGAGAPALADDGAAPLLPVFDAHIHYSHDAVEITPPAQAAALLRAAGVRRALVSSSDDNGTQKLLEAAPDIIVPALRPYRRRGEISTWMHDPTVIDYLESRLAAFEYEAIGEFHAFGDDIKTDVIQRMIAMAKERDLLLHHHGDKEAVDLIFRTWPQARVLWAHSGFDRPDVVREVLYRHPNLWADLAFRSDMAVRGGGLKPEWKALFEEFPDRFMVGTDTFAPERWYYVGDHAEFVRGWLADLEPAVAQKIAHENAAAMLSTRRRGWRCHGSAMTAETAEGAAPVALAFPAPTVSQPFDMVLSFCGAGTPPATVEVDATMPAHQHGMNYAPTVEPLGSNQVAVRGMVFHMPGAWRIAVTAAGEDGPQHYALDVEIQ